MEKKSMFLIVNPAARFGEIEKDFPRIKREFNNLGLSFDFRFTQKPGQAKEIAQKAVKEKYNIIVAVGGDFTVNEVGSALLGTESCLGVIPIGVGNDFARSLAIPRNIEKAVRILSAGQEISIDVIQVGEYFAFNVLGIGFDAAVAEWVQKQRVRLQKIKVLFKKFKLPFPLPPWCLDLAYLAGVLVNLFFYQNQEIEIATPRATLKGPSMMITLSNGQSEGRYFLIAPKASMEDGLIDVCLIGNVPHYKRLFCVIKGLKGKHLALREVAYFKTSELKISSTTPFLAHIDGELVQLPTDIEVKILARALRVIAGDLKTEQVLATSLKQKVPLRI